MYAKVFKQLFYRSMFARGDAQLVLVCLLAHADPDGTVELPAELIGAMTGMGTERAQAAIAELEAADPDSTSHGSDGKRIEPAGPGRWSIVNHGKYRGMRNDEERRRQTREAVARYRVSQRKPKVSQSKPNVSRGKPLKAQAEAEAEAEESTPSFNGTENPVPVEPVGGGDRITAKEAFASVFWPAYPRKVARLAAQKAFLKLVKDDSDDLFDSIMQALAWYQREEWANREPDKIPHAATWLNQQRYADAEAQTPA